MKILLLTIMEDDFIFILSPFYFVYYIWFDKGSYCIPKIDLKEIYWIFNKYWLWKFLIAIILLILNSKLVYLKLIIFIEYIYTFIKNITVYDIKYIINLNIDAYNLQ